MNSYRHSSSIGSFRRIYSRLFLLRGGEDPIYNLFNNHPSLTSTWTCCLWSIVCSGPTHGLPDRSGVVCTLNEQGHILSTHTRQPFFLSSNCLYEMPCSPKKASTLEGKHCDFRSIIHSNIMPPPARACSLPPPTTLVET